MAGQPRGIASARVVATGDAPYGHFRKNPWNPNKMGPFEHDKLVESINRFGFTDPITVRDWPGGPMLEIIDGEHRLEAGREVGIKSFPFINVGFMDDGEAKALGIILNELKGQHDPKLLGALLDDLLSSGSPEDMLKGMPFSDEALKGLTSLSSFDWSSLESKPEEAPKPSPKKGTSWKERTFRLPLEVDLVVEEALEKAKDGDEIEDWQALERVAADFLAN